MRPRQFTFFKNESFAELNRRAHGGDLRTGKRKLARPFDQKKPLHLVLRSSRAKGEWSFLRAKNERRVRDLVYREAHRSGVRVYRYANSGNHLHLLVKAPDRAGLARFLRSAAGLIARAVTGAKKGRATTKGHAPTPDSSSGIRKFWDRLVYSRIVEWGREFVRVQGYLDTNALEGLGWKEFGRPSKRKGFS